MILRFENFHGPLCLAAIEILTLTQKDVVRLQWERKTIPVYRIPVTLLYAGYVMVYIHVCSVYWAYNSRHVCIYIYIHVCINRSWTKTDWVTGLWLLLNIQTERNNNNLQYNFMMSISLLTNIIHLQHLQKAAASSFMCHQRTDLAFHHLPGAIG